MNGLKIAAGLILVLVAFYDLFQSVILPRPSVRKAGLVRWLLRLMWRVWRWAGDQITSQPRREALLATFGPIAVLTMFASWALILILGYGLILDGVGSEVRPPVTTLGTGLYFSATTLVPLSYGDYVPEGVPARLVIIAESITGVFLAALVITLLFTLYESFQRREELVVQLDAFAGAPPNGVQVLETAAQRGMHEQLVRTFEEWRGWSAAVLESHLAYPTLFWFRSSHDNEAWLNSFGAVMDAAVLVISTVDDDAIGPARLLYIVGNHLVEDLSWFFNFKPTDSPIVEKDEFDQARERLQKSGYKCGGEPDAWTKFSHLRARYASQLNQLARALSIIPAEWIGDRSYLPHRNRPGRRLR